ncbi:hypothetical protein GCM10011297_21000 [Bacterioplanes sanyensis]|uniref:P-loop ATPase, Sll1717 family n=1 Tax=Bacterioplanes sanyensis TaxID=1249553 RepID=UPI0016735EF3|nr:hypothetical protein [Bacterioplanes sanyensis]GGY47939.1 hypothetical protein GCM10011297_21000 [Bacterioplanes sanyensis]
MVFGQLSRNRKGVNGSVFLGSPEAEAEALPNSRMPLSKVYEDHCDLIGALANEKFIVVGRKGAGKSAFAEHICSIAEDQANLFARFIRQGESNLEQIVQLGIENGHEIEKENLYKWLILTNVLKMFSDNQAAQNAKEYDLLKHFISKNSGYIDIRESEVKELIRKQGFDININYLKRFFTSKMNKSLEIRQEKAPFYKLIPHLKEVLLKVLKSHSERENNNSYVLFFDDLDIVFDANNESTVNSLISLLRVSKEINNEFFAKNNLDSKVVILLRDDISKNVASATSDTAKIFSSYSVPINWYQDEYHGGDDELQLNIRKFINKRIGFAFSDEVIDVNSMDPWLSLVEDPFGGAQDSTKSSFKYILDHTFFRPRDLLLFFKPLSQHKYKFPLSKVDVNHLIGRYCEEVVNEIKNEFSCFYSSEQIATIFNAFGEISSELKNPKLRSITYQDAISIINRNCSGVSASELIEDMFYRSLIGGMGDNGYVYFKHREPATDVYEFNKTQGVIIHSALKVYCSNKGYA